MPEGSFGTGFSSLDSTNPNSLTASAGTLITAALENSGYFAQEMVLDQFMQVLQALTALIYLGSFVGAIITISLSGEYKSAVWFLIGPVAFYFTTLTRMEAQGTEWSFGTFQDKEARVEKINGTVDDSTANVSWLFHRYNTLVSSVVQNTVKVITNNSVKRQLLFTARSQIFDQILSSELKDPALNQLVAYGMAGECAKEMDAARIIAHANRYGKEILPGMPKPVRGQASIYNTALVNYLQLRERKFNLQKSDTVVVGYIAQLLHKLRTGPVEKTRLIGGLCVQPDKQTVDTDFFLYPDGKVSGAGPGTIGIAITEGAKTTCEQVWCWTALGFAEEARISTDAALKRLLDPALVGAYQGNGKDAISIDDPERSRVYGSIQEEILAAIATKMLKPVDLETHVVHENTEERAKEADEQRAKRKVDVGPGRIVQSQSRREDLSVVPIIVAGILFRNSFRDDARSKMMTQFARHAGIYTKHYNINNRMSTAQTIDIARLGNQHAIAQGLQYEVFTFASALPYVQGIMLFALAMLFPFFAILLVIPGKAHAFLSWMALWTWLKCWDIGWAFVMVADDFIWNLMPHASWFNIHTDRNHGPLTILESAFQYDFSYSLANYYMILGAMLFFVPIISGQAVLGAKQAVSGLMIQGVRGLAQNYGGAAADYIGVGNTQDGNYIREMAQLGFVNKNAFQDRTPANAEMAAWKKGEGESLAKAKNEHGIGKGLVTAGAIAAGVVAAVAIGLLAFTGIGVLAILGGAAFGLSAAGYLGWNQGLNTMRNGITGQREHHKRMNTYNTSNALLWYQKTSHDHMSWTGTRLRQAWSRRGQHWTVPQAPVKIPGQIMLMQAERQGMDEYMTGSFRGAMTSNLVATGEAGVRALRGGK